MKALLIPNFNKLNAPDCTRAVIAQLAECGIRPLLDETLNFSAEPKASRLPFAKALTECDLVIAVGGDGTILHAAKHAVRADKPLLGVNVGRMGFMASLEPGELALLSELRDGGYGVERRMMLDCIHLADGERCEYLALNDVVVSNGSLSRMVDLDVFCGGQAVVSYRADGVIFATPTGSTAYSLSAGGPILEPGMEGILLTPICPHSLAARTVIFSPEKLLRVSPGPLSRAPVYLTVDGAQGARLNPADKLYVRRSEKFLRLLTFKDASFYETIRQKFGFQAEDQQSER